MNKECLNKIVNNLKKEDNIKKYRPIPFWSWNDKLEEQELRRQVRWMKEQGFGGYFMHARSGLITEYLSDEWFNCIKNSWFFSLNLLHEYALSCNSKSTLWLSGDKDWRGEGEGYIYFVKPSEEKIQTKSNINKDNIYKN